MNLVEATISQNVLLAWVILAISFVILAKCADIFVDSSIALADRFNIPKLIIGIVMVSLATTAPEISVSLIAAMRGNPEMALGNAIGSVICDDGIALALAGIVAAAPILVIPHVLKTSAIFLIIIELLTFLFIVPDLTLSRIEGSILVLLLVGYLSYLYYQHKNGKYKEDLPLAEIDEDILKEKRVSFPTLILLFSAGLAGIILSSHFVVLSATSIAMWLRIPESVIALTLVALGTSVPEIATCIVAARKNEGAIAVGNILGADILNICWVAGLSAVVNPLTLQKKEVYFMFPSMFIIVFTMLIMLRAGYRLTKTKGFILLGLYILYITSFFLIFPQTS